MDLPPITLENGTVIDAVMVVVDHGLTKGVVLTPCTKNLTHEGADNILLNHVLDSLTVLSLIKTLNSLPNHSKNFSNF